MIPTNRLTLNIISVFDILNSSYPDWLKLYNRCKNIPPFLSPDWQLPWWKYFGNDSRLNVIEIHAGNHLIGLAPVLINYNGENGARELKLIGTGNSDYLDVILDDEFTVPGMQLIYQYLTDTLTHKDYCYFQGLQITSPFLSFTPPKELIIEIVKKDISPVILLPSTEHLNESILDVDRTGDMMNGLLSKDFHKYLKRNKRILGESGLLELITADQDNINSYLNELFVLHKRRWELKEQTGVLSDKNVQSFLIQVAVNLFSNGSIKIYKLLHNNITIAIIYLLIKNRIAYNYLGGFNPDYKKFSPGSILLYEVLKVCFESGYIELNMLNGEEDYKYRWGAVDKMNYTIMIKHK